MSDEIQWRRTYKPELGAKEWKSVPIGGKKYLIKSYFNVGPADPSYQILLTNRVSLWHEELQDSLLQKRSKRLNPNLEAPMHKLLAHLETQLDDTLDGSKFQVDVGEAGKLCLSMTSKLAGLPFSWNFDMSPASKAMMCEHLTTPLLVLVQEQARREVELVKSLALKDKELEDLRAQGAKSTRRHLETGVFDHTAFNNTMDTSQGFEEGVKQNGDAAFDPNVQTLYRRIMEKRAWLNRPPSADMDEDTQEDGVVVGATGATAGQSWANRVPASLNVGTASSPTKSPSKSPSPVKDTELLRRQALERRLQEEELRKEQNNAKKRKKIRF